MCSSVSLTVLSVMGVKPLPDETWNSRTVWPWLPRRAYRLLTLYRCDPAENSSSTAMSVRPW